MGKKIFTDIDKTIEVMTLEEKAKLCSGKNFWCTEDIDRCQIPSIHLSDGPHGLRAIHDGGTWNCIEAVCFPTSSLLACSFDRTLVNKVGKTLGSECQSEEIAVLLGPGANIKRSPLCGRNFEYFSEDPYLASQMAIAHITGVQSNGVGTSLKHFAANNQENRRMSVDEKIDERTLNEIYLAAFEDVVKEAKPWTVMCSYNKINGEYVSQKKEILTDTLRDKWGYEGLVVSDWGACDDRVKSIEAGLDLEMPCSFGKNDKRIVEAVKNGRLSEKSLDKVVRRILELIEKAYTNKREGVVFNKEKDHDFARKAAADSIVLLKNKKNILPLSSDKKIAFIGSFADKPRFQGGGSSHIKASKVTSALDAVGKICEVAYCKGYNLEDDSTDYTLLNEAIEVAKSSEVAVIFAGLPESFESEGYDRKHMKMPSCQNELIKRVCEAQPNTVVVLHNGSPIEMPWLDDVKGLVEVYLGGQAIGGATVDVLFGVVNPSGKLAETFPKKLSDNPSYLNFPGEKDNVVYAEGIYVGYRYYDKKEIEPQFEFGYGLSYTTFEYSNLVLSSSEIDEDEILSVSVTVTNTGEAEGKEIIQLYVSDKESSASRPIRELKGFEKITLKAGESKKVVFRLDRKAFAYYNPDISDWYVESGEFDICIGASSRDIRLCEPVYVNSHTRLRGNFTLDSTGGDILSYDEGAKLFNDLLCNIDIGVGSSNPDAAVSPEMAKAMFWDMPIHAIVSFVDIPGVTRESLQNMIDQLNQELNKD